MKTTGNAMAEVVMAGALASGVAQAALFDRDGEMIYDDVLNITWLQDANYAKTSGYDADGRMNWSAANAWAAGLKYGGYSDWRLPTVNPIAADFNGFLSNNGTTDWGWGNTSPNSEMAYMYYVNLGNKGFCTPDDAFPSSCVEQPGWGLANVSPFSNLQSFVYWSGSVSVWFPDIGAWGFATYDGGQRVYGQEGEAYAWAVRPGDVAAVPEPSTLRLLGLALAGIGATRRRRSFGA